VVTVIGDAPPWAVRIVSELDASDEHATRLAGTLTSGQLNWRARPDAWSVGQCLDHLAIANDVYLSAMAPALEGQPEATVQEITPGWFGRLFIRRYIDPATQQARGRAPRKIAPHRDVDRAILARFLAGNRDARALVRQAAHLDVNRIRFTNPFIPVIHFTVGTGLEILSRHQRRHLLQADRVRQAAGFPGP